MPAPPTITPPLTAARRGVPAPGVQIPVGVPRVAGRPIFVPAVLLLSLVLIRTPTLLGPHPPYTAYGLSLAPFAAAIAVLALRRAEWRASISVLLALGYVGLLSLAAVRGAQYDAISRSAAALEVLQFALLTILAMFAFLREPSAEHRARHLAALCWAPVAFVATAVALHLVGFVSPGQDLGGTSASATMLHLLHVSTHRVAFPMSGGLNGIGPSAAAALVVCIVFVQRRERRNLAIVGGLLSLYVILAIDSRGALLFSLLAVGVITFIPRAKRRRLGLAAIALPVLPVFLVIALGGLAKTSVGASLNRSSTETINTGTGRTLVWQRVLDVLDEPRIADIWGYGQSGQVTSGVSASYAYLFVSDADPQAHTAHNLVLQTALDSGWVGVLSLLALVGVVLSRLARLAPDPHYTALAAAALALLLLGIVQDDPTPIQSDSFAFWLLLIFAAMRTRESVATDGPGLGGVAQWANRSA